MPLDSLQCFFQKFQIEKTQKMIMEYLDLEAILIKVKRNLFIKDQALIKLNQMELDL